MSTNERRLHPEGTSSSSSALFNMSNAQVMITGGTFTNVNHIDTAIDYGEIIEKYFRGHIAADATHDTYESADPPQCHPGTRTAILQKLMEWAQKKDNDSFISWVFGPAGVGKSAIGHSLAELLVQGGQLAASFFFFRTAERRNTEKFLVSTLAYQLAYSFPEIQAYIAAILKRNPLVLQQSVGSQFQKLVIEPMCLLSRQDAHKVVIIDGLDECQDRNAQRLIITTISKAAPRLAGWLRFLILSRSEYQIESTFHLPAVRSITFSTDLKKDLTAFDDILLFLLAKFDEIKRMHPLKSKIEPSWPGEDTIRMLVQKSSGNFIYPQTVMKYIQNDYQRPQNRLKVVLGLIPSSDSPFAELDDLYLHILSQVRTDQATLLRLLRTLVACMSDMHTGELNFTTAFVEMILSMEPGDARLVLVDLQSLIAFDSDLDSECDCHTFPEFMHTSFPDFLLDPLRSKEYWIDVEQGYLDIACGALKALKTRNTRPLCANHAHNPLRSYYHIFLWSYERSPIGNRDDLQAAFLAHDTPLFAN
ncbi:hypothetical protein GALMADRAFT_145123 [Galerina marginata CBS 339.88]|uniref:NACHT domain-containing protein n=1 Tax=Galerina marginata (strain CBS 339.88) TaxID=685588 RepID=A0A067SQZ1_GALM3|nr:hypothetical protein GALMADRAFT_145123 [Galerina marginata CBS 339.88]